MKMRDDRNKRSTWLLIALVAVAAGVQAANQWNGAGGNADWFDGANWSEGVPAPDQEVSLATGNVLLTNETAALASFSMSGGTLTFSNWTTRLQADTVVVSGGTVTLPPAFTEQQMSNRVWIVCEDFTLESAGIVNVNGCGFAGNNGPGTGGPGTTTGYGGAGYGGVGSSGNLAWSAAGPTYGSAVLPLDPGSGAAGTEAGAGAGGGAVWIEATGDVVLNGSIHALGTKGTASHSGGGSGGAILIQGHTIMGDGTLRAIGGDKYGLGGQGGGGRIALHFNPAAQTALPGMTVTAAGYGGRAEMGTLYVTQLDVMLPTGTFPAQWDKVKLATPEFSTWELPALAVGKTIGLPDLRELKIAGDMNVEAGGNLTLSSGSESLPQVFYGLYIEVGGELAVADGGTLALRSDPTNDVAPYVECGRLTVHTGGTINGNGLGFIHGSGIEPGIGIDRGGGGHGGSGGSYPGYGIGGSPYGLPHRPWHAGCGGGTPDRGGYGGGALRIRARGTARLDGTLSANGMTSIRAHGGGGAGGTILLTAARLEGAGGVLSANGANGATLGCGGGGGRIAVLTPSLPPEMLAALGVEPKPNALVPVHPEDWENAEGTATLNWGHFSGTVNVLPGATYHPGTPGTIFFGALRLGTLLMLQ